jgi:acetamidase/formamidase
MTLHRFTPTRYYNAIGSHEPALRVADGDTIEATCVDAMGCDEHGQQVATRGNPMSGPFYVEGAEPGDTLVVEIDSIVPNRRRGITGASVAPNVVDPEYVRHLPSSTWETPVQGEWDVDVEAGTATLVAPQTKLGRFTLPLAPMVGCFGVAPARGQAISTATSGEHGGNMDYRGFAPGVTVYFPVFVPGALLHFGDGHAVQGDGEIVGTGIEISTTMRMTVRIQKGRRIAWPRGENATHIFTVGNARPLDQCVQHATTEMLRWLQQDYGLDPIGASLLLGQVVEYDLGNVFDPASTMVCKVSKKVLASIRS